MAYVYRMYVGDEIKYIGYTTDMKSRMTNHFVRITSVYSVKVLSVEQAMSVTRVEYAEVGASNGRVLEAYLIAKIKPEWNKDFVEKDELTYELNTGDIEWHEWEVTTKDNPHHHIFIWRDGVLLYEIPKIHEVYDPLCKELGIEQDMNFGYAHPVYIGKYKLMRLSGKRRVLTGKLRHRAKYSFMGYPDAWNDRIDAE